MIFNSELLLTLWTNNPVVVDYLSFPLQLLIFGRLLNSLMTLPYEMQLAYGWTSLTLKMNLILVIVLLPALFIFVPEFKLNAAAIIWIILNLAYLIFSVNIMHKRILVGEKFRWYIHDILKPLFFGLVPAIFMSYVASFFTSMTFKIFILVLHFPLILIFMIYGSNLIKKQAISLFLLYYKKIEFLK
jgi:O-antigen/teichoic acid export membrane protein